MGNEESISIFEEPEGLEYCISEHLFSVDGFQSGRLIKKTKRGKIEEIFDPQSNEHFIAKVLELDITKYNDSFILLNLINNLSQINYPTILPFVGFSISNKLFDNHPIIVYKNYSSGLTLSDVLELENSKKTPEWWNSKAKFKTACGIIYAVNYLHKNNIVHGSICTDNIVFDDNHWPYLANFSFTHIFGDKTVENEHDELWRAPELKDSSEKSKEGDVFALAMVLYQLFSGQTMSSMVKQAPEIEKRMKMDNRPKLGAGFPAIFKKIIHNSWAPNPDSRWAIETSLSNLTRSFSKMDERLSKFVTDFIKEIQEQKDLTQKSTDTFIEAHNGDPLAMCNYGILLKAGKGVPRNLAKSVQYFKNSADKKCPEGMINLAYALENGAGVRQNVLEAEKYFKKAADMDNKNAQYSYAQLLLKTSKTPESAKEAASYFKKAADQGHSSAMYRYGLLLEFGEGVKKNIREAANYYKESASLNFPPAMYKYGSLIITGKLKDVKVSEGLKNVSEAANRGYPRANCLMGALQLSGTFVQKSIKNARINFKKGSADGEPAGDFGLAIADLLEGRIVGLNHLKKAADGGYVDAEKIYAHFVLDEKRKKALIKSSEETGIQKEVVTNLNIMLKGTNIKPDIDGVVNAFLLLIKKLKREQKIKSVKQTLDNSNTDKKECSIKNDKEGSEKEEK